MKRLRHLSKDRMLYVNPIGLTQLIENEHLAWKRSSLVFRSRCVNRVPSTNTEQGANHVHIRSLLHPRHGTRRGHS